jgi:predicted Zn-dependent protease
MSADRTVLRLLAALCLALFALLAGCDEKIEKTIGDMSAKSIESEYRVVDDPLVSDWITTTGHTMLGYVVRQSIPYEFKVIDTDIVNAFAAPYGHVYVTTGLLDFCETESEVWGVVGHEIGHVTHRHSISSVKKGILYDIGLAILGGKSQGMADVAGIGLGLLSLRYSRENEYEADDMGRRLSYAAGYDPRGQVDFFGRLQAKYEKKKPSSIEVMFQTHPTSDKRAARQMAMPELSVSNPDALLQTGLGYARRFEVRRAHELLAQAVALRPSDPTFQLALADTQMLRGQYSAAQGSYQAASALRASRYAAEGVRLAASAMTGGTTAPASAQELSLAAALLPDARAAATRTVAAMTGASTRAATLETTYAPTIKGAQSVLSSLLGMADADAKLDDSQSSIVTFANGAVNRAIEPVYTVEQQREALQTMATQTAQVAAGIERKLAMAAAGQCVAGDAVVLKRALAENRLAAADIQTALAGLEEAQPVVKSAADAATDATKAMDRVLRGDRSAGASSAVQKAAQLAESRALVALAATQKAKQAADRAEVRSLISRINLAVAGVPPQRRSGLQGLIAHYTLQRPTTVSALLDEGVGYGEVALVLAGLRTAKLDASDFLRSSAGVSSMVDQVNSVGGKTEGARILLKYLADTIEYEAQS